jgi:hypothetical protein
MQLWLDAAAAYEAAKQPGYVRPQPAPPEPPETLSGFMASDKGEAAKKLLAAANTWILLGESESAMSRTTSVAMDGEGLKRSHQVVGMAAAFSKEKAEIVTIDAEEALELLRSFDVSQREALGHIYAKLTELVAAAPGQ